VSFPGKLHPPSDPRGDADRGLFSNLGGFVSLLSGYVSYVSCMYLACILHVFCMYFACILM
jgi:hypothetical protein